MKKVLLILTIFFCFSLGIVLGQSTGSYRSRQVGDWNQATTWEVFNSGAWHNLEDVGAGSYRNVIPSNASGIITISSNTIVTIPNGVEVIGDQIEFGTATPMASLIVASGGIFNVRNGPGNDLRLFNDGINFSQLLVTGLIRLQGNATIVNDDYSGTVLPASHPTTVNTYKVFSGGAHVHNSSDELPYADWQQGSTFVFFATNTNPIISDVSIQFHNFVWEGTYQTSNLSFAGMLRNVNGIFRVNTTNGRTLTLGSGSNYTLNVAGNFDIQGSSSVQLNTTGTATLNIGSISTPSNFSLLSGNVLCSFSGTTTINLSGDFIMSGGTFSLRSQSASTGGVTNLNVRGNLVQSGGTITRTGGGGLGNISFIGSGTSSEFVRTGGTITNIVNFAVFSGKTLDLGTSAVIGSGAFTLYSGSTLNVGSPGAAGAIQSNTTGGNIRVSGSRTYQSGSTIVYNGLAAQFMGTGHPAPPNTIIENPSGVILLSNVSFNGNLIVNGPFNTQQQAVTFGGGLIQTISGSNAVAFYDVIVNKTASNLTLSTNVDIVNRLSINSATTLDAGTQRLRLLSTPDRTANVSQLPAGASITGSVIVQRFLPKVVERRQYHYLASPVIGTTLADWGETEPEDIPLGRAYRWNEPTQVWDRIFPTTTLTNGRGYIVDIATTDEVTTDVSGPLGQGNVNVSLTRQAITGDYKGMNLIGNPYPSAIDWDNITVPSGVSNAVYLVDNFGNSGQGTGTQIDVSYVDGIGTPAGYSGAIAQGQSFLVFATADATLTFTEAAKITPTNTQFFRKEEIPNVLRIVLDGKDVKDETVIRLRDGATDNFDQQFDAYKLAKEKSNIATLTSDNVKAVINALGTSECNKIIPLVTEAMQQGSYTLSFVGMESFDSFVSISLMDLVEKTTIDIRKQQEYSFTVTGQNIGSIPSRFQISIEGNSPSINNSIAAFGETICDDKATATVTLETSEPGVEYTVEWNGAKISDPATGTGSMLQLTIRTSDLLAGENNITIKAQSGTCSSTVLSAKPVITKMKTGEINIVQNGVLCGEGQATLIVSGAAEEGWYQWYDSYDSQNPIPDQNGAEFVTPHLAKSKTYYVAAVNGQGCEGIRKAVSATVSYADEVSLTRNGTTLLSSSETGNQWFFNGELLIGETGNALEALESGLYTVNVASGGCNKSASMEVTGVESEGGISIFPNPTANKVFIRVNTANNNVTATLVNAQGVEIATKALVGTGSAKEAEFDIQAYASGIYNVRILDGGKVVIRKIAKVK